MGGCVCVQGCIYIPIFPRTSIWWHDNTPRTLNLPRTGHTHILAKYWLKTPKTSCFTNLGGVRFRGLIRPTTYFRTHKSSVILVMHWWQESQRIQCLKPFCPPLSRCTTNITEDTHYVGTSCHRKWGRSLDRYCFHNMEALCVKGQQVSTGSLW